MKNLLLLLMACAMAGPAMAADKKDDKAAGPAVCPELQASTVFVKDQTGSRTTGSAKRMTEAHREAAGKGWSFSDFEPYTEDGDLKGFFITYTRKHPCNNH